MKRIVALLFLCALFAYAVSAMADGATCMTGSPAATATCSPGTSYGVAVTTSDVEFLDPDKAGGRTCMFLHAYSGNGGNICIAQNAAASTATPPNCIVELVPGASQWLYNFPNGNGAFQVWNMPLHAIAASGTQSLAFSYCR